MNIFLNYKKKIFNSLKILERKKAIKIPKNFSGLAVELPPQKENCDISCNAALILAKYNNISSINLANNLKKYFLSTYKEFKKIEVAGPGFLNIYFDISFWKKHLFEIIELDKKYGSNRTSKKKYNIEFVSANPTGPLHVGHCRGAILGDSLSKILTFNGHKVIKEYYVNDYGGQIKNFVTFKHFVTMYNKKHILYFFI